MIKTEEAHLIIRTASHPGMVGKENEDRYGVAAFMTGAKSNLPSVLAVLCDGIGGHRAGEAAAAIGVEMITARVTESDGSEPLAVLEQAIVQASQAVYETSQSDQGCQGMGTTCACAWVIDDRLYTANLGDSRIYLLREGHLIQLTTDHTWIQEALDAGIITEAERGKHPNAHVIRRFLGSEKIPQPDFRLWFFEDESDEEALENQGLILLPGDILLLCSDGLTDLVSDDEICKVLLDKSPSCAPETLIKMANERGGHDNTTVVTLVVPGEKIGVSKKTHQRRKLVGWVSVLVILGMVISAAIWWNPLSEMFQAGNMTLTQTEVADQPVLARTTVPVLPSLTNTVTTEAESIDSQGMPIPTMTPWPTHTQAP